MLIENKNLYNVKLKYLLYIFIKNEKLTRASIILRKTSSKI